MPTVAFTSNLERHIDCPTKSVRAASVREALDGVFRENPSLESYIVDDHRRLRKHVMIFVDGLPVVDRDRLSDSVGEQSEIYVMQALSGG